MIGLPFDDEIDIRQLENIFDDMTNSYKIFWFLGVFEEIIINKKREISFKQVVARMIVKSWYPLLNYKLNFGSQDQMAKNINKINDEYINDRDISKYNLYKILSETMDIGLERIMKEFYKYVPYRLLRGFYRSELRGIKDPAINKSIEELANKDDKVFYKISSKNKSIYINENWYDYILKNQNIIKGWANYNLILFLQHRNPSVPSISLKLEPPIERDLTMAKKYWDAVIKNIEVIDIYTGQPFINEKYKDNGPLSIDHFLPWSFVGHDELWNLIPTFRNVNSSKSDFLPRYDEYIDRFAELQFNAINFIRTQNDCKKYLNDFLTIDKTLDIKEIIDIRREINKGKFISDLKRTINPLYQIAYSQGFQEWSYSINSKGIIELREECDNCII